MKEKLIEEKNQKLERLSENIRMSLSETFPVNGTNDEDPIIEAVLTKAINNPNYIESKEYIDLKDSIVNSDKYFDKIVNKAITYYNPIITEQNQDLIIKEAERQKQLLEDIKKTSEENAKKEYKLTIYKKLLGDLLIEMPKKLLVAATDIINNDPLHNAKLKTIELEEQLARLKTSSNGLDTAFNHPHYLLSRTEEEQEAKEQEKIEKEQAIEEQLKKEQFDKELKAYNEAPSEEIKEIEIKKDVIVEKTPAFIGIKWVYEGQEPRNVTDREINEALMAQQKWFSEREATNFSSALKYTSTTTTEQINNYAKLYHEVLDYVKNPIFYNHNINEDIQKSIQAHLFSMQFDIDNLKLKHSKDSKDIETQTDFPDMKEVKEINIKHEEVQTDYQFLAFRLNDTTDNSINDKKAQIKEFVENSVDKEGIKKLFSFLTSDIKENITNIKVLEPAKDNYYAIDEEGKVTEGTIGEPVPSTPTMGYVISTEELPMTGQINENIDKHIE